MRVGLTASESWRRGLDKERASQPYPAQVPSLSDVRAENKLEKRTADGGQEKLATTMHDGQPVCPAIPFHFASVC